MMQINRFSFGKGFISLVIALSLTGCVDDKYDLKDIDTTSRVTVNNLTVPVNLESIKLDNVIDMDDNENIKTLTDANGNKYYALQEDGDFSTSSFHINAISVPAVPIAPLEYHVGLNLNTQSAFSGSVNMPSDLPMSEYHFNMNNIDPALISLKNIKAQNPITLEVKLSVNREFVSNGNQVTFKNVNFRLPWGLISDAKGYDKATGHLVIDELPVNNDGTAKFTFKATGLELGSRGQIKNHKLDISDQIGLTAAEIAFELNSMNVPGQIDINLDFDISSFIVNRFSGEIDYHMDNIDIDPISLSDLPDFLNSPDTKISIANPTIDVDVNNPVGGYGIEGRGYIKLTSDFNNGNTTTAQSDMFTISTNGADLSFGPGATAGNHVEFNNLSNILLNGNVGGLPEKIYVNLVELQFVGEATDFPLGNDIESAKGKYTFDAPLGFGDGSIVVYEDTESGWSSDDLDKVYIEHIKLNAKCSTNLPVGISLKVIPVDKNGDQIPVKEDSSKFDVEPNSNNKEVSLTIEGANGPITNFDGVTFRAVITQNSGNTEAIGPDQYIELNDLRIAVDGYYETDF